MYRQVTSTIAFVLGLLLAMAVSHAQTKPTPYPDNPGDVVKAMVTAASAQDFDTARTFMDADFIAFCDAIYKDTGGVKGFWAKLMNQFTVDSVDYTEPRMNGDKAKVRISMHFKDKTNGGTAFMMEKKDGKWVAHGI